MPPAAVQSRRAVAAAKHAKSANNRPGSSRNVDSTRGDDAPSQTSSLPQIVLFTRDKCTATAAFPLADKPSKRTQVKHACYQCRSTKLKCSGNHPQCTRCSSRGLLCEYDVPSEDVTRMQHLRNQILASDKELHSAKALLDLMRHGTDQEATRALARFRTGDSVELVLQQALTDDFRNWSQPTEDPSSLHISDAAWVQTAAQDFQTSDAVKEHFWYPFQQPMQR